MDQLFNILIWAAVFQGVFLGILFISSGDSKSTSNKLLGFFLLALVIEALGSFLPYDNIFGYPVGLYFELPEVKILIPLFFTHYVLAKIGVDATYKTFLKINYGAAFLVLLGTVFNLLLFLITGNNIYEYIDDLTMETIYMTQFTYAVLLTIIGISIATKEVFKYKSMVASNYTDMDLLSVSWLWRLVLLLLVAGLLWSSELIRIYIGLATGNFSTWDFNDYIWGIIIFFIYFVSYRAFRKRDLLEGITPIPELKNTSEQLEQDDAQLSESLTQAMEEEKMYLDTELTVYDVAKHIGASTRKVSSCINSQFGQNFSEWVNQYRVEEVKQLFKSPDTQNLTIEAIGQDSGFKSRSAMYAAFKKFTGQSPAHFK